ncbi:hypothetical protein V6N13_102340 [Hibiscus sabdariffa]|uniref:Uncharacterized protein n=1 Tax=Hibiscus sabdariffa TaxID=183260 RepID=A0ABR2D5G9_9ROSI
MMSRWGDALFIEDENLLGTDFSIKRIKILTKHLGFIEESISLSCAGVCFEVMVREFNFAFWTYSSECGFNMSDQVDSVNKGDGEPSDSDLNSPVSQSEHLQEDMGNRHGGKLNDKEEVEEVGAVDSKVDGDALILVLVVQPPARTALNAQGFSNVVYFSEKSNQLRREEYKTIRDRIWFSFLRVLYTTIRASSELRSQGAIMLVFLPMKATCCCALGNVSAWHGAFQYRNACALDNGKYTYDRGYIRVERGESKFAKATGSFSIISTDADQGAATKLCFSWGFGSNRQRDMQLSFGGCRGFVAKVETGR